MLRPRVWRQWEVTPHQVCYERLKRLTLRQLWRKYVSGGIWYPISEYKVVLTPEGRRVNALLEAAIDSAIQEWETHGFGKGTNSVTPTEVGFR